MSGRLGCSINKAYITSKCNGVRICDLEADKIYYDRRLDDISEAQIEIPRTGTRDDCCHCVTDVWPLCHELVIYREDDGIVWQGVVTEVVESSERLIVRAKDKLVWMTLRVLEVPLSVTNTVALGTKLTDISEKLYRAALAKDPTSCPDECVVNLGDGLPASFSRDRIFNSFDGTMFDLFQSLAQSGVDYSVVRGCLILGGEPSDSLPPIATLTDEHLLGTVEIVKSYLDYGNDFFVRYTGDTDAATCIAQGNVVNGKAITPCPAESENTNHQCFGLVQRIVDGVDGLPTVKEANVVAKIYSDQLSVAPRRIDFPPGTKLAPETPWDINDMIPGQQVRVALSDYCSPVDQQFILQKVTVEDGIEGEQISIDLGPINKLTSAP